MGPEALLYARPTGGFDHSVLQHSFAETDHESISTAILSLPLTQKGSCQLLAKYWLIA